MFYPQKFQVTFSTQLNSVKSTQSFYRFNLMFVLSCQVKPVKPF